MSSGDITINGHALTERQGAALRTTIRRRLRRLLADGDEPATAAALAAVLLVCVGPDPVDVDRKLIESAERKARERRDELEAIPIEDRLAGAKPISPVERKAAEDADAREEFDAPASRLVRLADARDATALGLRELRARPDAREQDILDREDQLRRYEAEMEEIRREVV